LPDGVVRFGIRRLLAERLREERRTSEEAQQRHLMRFLAQLKADPLAFEAVGYGQGAGFGNRAHPSSMPCPSL